MSERAPARTLLSDVDLSADLFASEAPGVERRVRFLELRLEHPRIGYASAHAVLEWKGVRFAASSGGEGGPLGELRVSALAAIEALEQVLQRRITLELLGIKSLRVFDHDLVAVILRCPQAPDRQLVGLSMVQVDTHRSAALAVLNATNRLLGNYLTVAD